MQRHVSVLAKEVYDYLPKQLNYYFDGTLWHGWHVEYVLSNLKLTWDDRFETIKVVWVDRDIWIMEKAKNYLEEYKNKIIFHRSSYSDIDLILEQNKLSSIDAMLLDLWVNMEHFKDYTRGFSIKEDASLDMRFDITWDFTAEKMLQTYSLEKLKKVFIEYWDFTPKFAEFMSQEIINARTKNPIKTVFQLKKVLETIRMNDKKIAVVFQCIRIEVNHELDELKIFLDKFHKYLSKWGRCMIMTYHSIEDRITKYAFKELVETWKFKLVTKHVIKPTFQEVSRNRAARSAKLRIIEAL